MSVTVFIQLISTSLIPYETQFVQISKFPDGSIVSPISYL